MECHTRSEPVYKQEPCEVAFRGESTIPLNSPATKLNKTMDRPTPSCSQKGAIAKGVPVPPPQAQQAPIALRFADFSPIKLSKYSTSNLHPQPRKKHQKVVEPRHQKQPSITGSQTPGENELQMRPAAAEASTFIHFAREACVEPLYCGHCQCHDHLLQYVYQLRFDRATTCSCHNRMSIEQ